MTASNGAQGGAARFLSDFPDVWDAYARLGEAAAKAGALSARERRLVKLAMAIGAGSEGAVHSHARRGADDGLAQADMRQVCLLAITTLGFPAAMAAMSWVDDIAKDKPGETR